jgi:putative PIN family toxin of toxin-antitoxin system
MKIVIDTNIIVAALMSREGVSNRFMIWIFEHKEKLNVVSNTLVTEYEDVLLREKNRKLYKQFSKENLQSLIDDICLKSHHQKINFLWRPFLKDIQDDMVLETAFNAGCEYIITYNVKDFSGVEEKFAIKSITPKEFLKIIGEL